MSSRILLILLSLLLNPMLTYAEALFKDNQGNEIAFSNLKGKWVYINYWASWCPSCVEEISEFNRFYEHHKNENLALYAVNFDGLSQRKQNVLSKRFNIRYPSLLQDPREALQLGDIPGIPVTFIFNPKGKLVETLYGGQTLESLDKIMNSA